MFLIALVRVFVLPVMYVVEKNAYCIDIITQTSAIKQGLSNIENILMEGHLGHCVVNQIKGRQTSKAVKEILKVYQLKRK